MIIVVGPPTRPVEWCEELPECYLFVPRDTLAVAVHLDCIPTFAMGSTIIWVGILKGRTVTPENEQ